MTRAGLSHPLTAKAPVARLSLAGGRPSCFVRSSIKLLRAILDKRVLDTFVVRRKGNQEVWRRHLRGVFRAPVHRAVQAFVYDNETCVLRVFAYI